MNMTVDALNKIPEQKHQNISYNLTQQRPPAFMALYDKIDTVIGNGVLFDCCCFGKITNKDCCWNSCILACCGGLVLSGMSTSAGPLVACSLCNFAMVSAMRHEDKIKLWRENMKQREELAHLLPKAPRQHTMKTD